MLYFCECYRFVTFFNFCNVDNYKNVTEKLRVFWFFLLAVGGFGEIDFKGVLSVFLGVVSVLPLRGVKAACRGAKMPFWRCVGGGWGLAGGFEGVGGGWGGGLWFSKKVFPCLLYTSDAADECCGV